LIKLKKSYGKLLAIKNIILNMYIVLLYKGL